MLDDPLFHLLAVVLVPATSLTHVEVKKQLRYTEASRACARGRKATTIRCMALKTK